MIWTCKATVDDARAIAEVHAASWHSACCGVLPDGFLSDMSVDDGAMQWTRTLSTPAPRSSHEVVKRDGRIIGYVGWGPWRDASAEREGAGEIHCICLHPDEWSKGIGRKLIEDALRGLEAGGFSEVRLWVLEGDERARLFCERSQLERDGATRSARYGDAIVRLACYRRAL